MLTDKKQSDGFPTDKAAAQGYCSKYQLGQESKRRHREKEGK